MHTAPFLLFSTSRWRSRSSRERKRVVSCCLLSIWPLQRFFYSLFTLFCFFACKSWWLIVVIFLASRVARTQWWSPLFAQLFSLKNRQHISGWCGRTKKMQNARKRIFTTTLQQQQQQQHFPFQHAQTDRRPVQSAEEQQNVHFCSKGMLVWLATWGGFGATLLSNDHFWDHELSWAGKNSRLISTPTFFRQGPCVVASLAAEAFWSLCLSNFYHFTHALSLPLRKVMTTTTTTSIALKSKKVWRWWTRKGKEEEEEAEKGDGETNIWWPI